MLHVRTFLSLRNLTESRVFWISGILSLRPPIRFCRFISMNWYFLPRHARSAPVLCRAAWSRLLRACIVPELQAIVNSRYHLLEAAESGFDVISCGNIVLDLIDKRGIGDAPRIGRCSIFTIWYQFLLVFLASGCEGIISRPYLVAASFPFDAILSVLYFQKQNEVPAVLKLLGVGGFCDWATFRQWGLVPHLASVSGEGGAFTLNSINQSLYQQHLTSSTYIRNFGQH